MFETGIRQVRMALSMVWGRPISPRNIERLIDDALETLHTFGAPGDDVQQLLDGPFADPEARREFQTRGLRRTAKRLARLSPFYSEMFTAAGVDAGNLTPDDMAQLPATRKADLVSRPRDFVVRGSKPFVTTRTTGTTGKPAEVWLSRYEVELWPAIAALSGLLRNEISPDDCMQINISSRATAAVQQNLTVCRLVGARSRMLGVVPPDESLDSLLASQAPATLLATYPSYLAQLVQAARRRGLGPQDFSLRRIDCGGEVLSSTLAAAARATFGTKIVNDTFGMTEVLPVSGRACDSGHLHHDLNTGFVEVIDLETSQPAEPGRLGTVVITPYFPYRECMPVFRYDTRDVVRRLPDEPLTCELAGVPGTSQILGKADHLLRLHDDRVVTARDLVEVVESLPSRPWPARFGATVTGGQVQLRLPSGALDGAPPDELSRRLAARGLSVDVATVLEDGDGSLLRPLRADLLETTFVERN